MRRKSAAIGFTSFILAGAACIPSAVFLVSGCASSTPKDLDAHGARALIQPTDMINVALADADRTRNDHVWLRDFEGKESYSTGPQWARVFIGRIGHEPLFTIRQGKVSIGAAVGGLAMKISYSVDGILSYDGRDWPISVEGTKSGAGFLMSDSDATAAAAVHEGIVKAADACRAIIGGRPEGK